MNNPDPFFLSLQERADFRVLVTVTLMTNATRDWFVEPGHAARITTISNLADQGLTMKAIAEALKVLGYSRSCRVLRNLRVDSERPVAFGLGFQLGKKRKPPHPL